tara:strand:+ start:252 stop:518 length:267 start_codon:yes stop_codon:yes gene_type:complete
MSKKVGLTQFTEEDVAIISQDYSDKKKFNDAVVDVITEIQKEKVLDILNELENKVDDLSQQCCYTSYEVENTIHDLQVSIDKIKEIVT